MYTDQSTIEGILGRSLTSSEESVLSLLLTLADNFINDQLGGSFGTVAESTRYYDGGQRILDIDAVNTITKVALVYTDETDNYEYDTDEELEARPRNETTKTYLHSRIGKFPRGVANIAVTGKFTLGASVPDDIKYLAGYLIAKIFQNTKSGNVKKESIEGYSREFADYKTNDELVVSILDRYDKEILI